MLVVSAFPAYAQSSQDQPLEGYSWPTSQIPLYIQPISQVSGQASTSAAYAKQAVLDAMNTWNAGQKWFISTYMSGQGNPYSYGEINSTPESGVVVSFNQTQTSGDNWGWTSYYYRYGGDKVINKVTVQISIILTFRDGSALSRTDLQATATHELGHALGLDHTHFSELDLMNHLAPGHGVTLPSSLNLYAVYLLSKTNKINQQPSSPVTLPNNIPYTQLPQTALVEFSITSLSLLGVLTTTGLALCMRRTTDK